VRIAIQATAAALAFALPAAAQTPWASERLADVEFRVRLIQDPKAIAAIVGDELDGEFVLVEIEAKSFYDTKLAFDRDDFLLRSRANNEKSPAQSPSRIAGSAVYSMETQKARGGGVFRQSQDAIIVPGAGTGGQPRRIDPGLGTIGGSVGQSGETTVRAGESGDDGSLKGRLEKLEFPLAESDRDRRGYLYFQIAPKHKLKHIVFYYDGKHGRFQTQFEK
jgi:hypothetical protein